MKREGRQHGMARTFVILPELDPRPKTRYINRFDSPTTAGPFTRVSNKPTNHSKFTGKAKDKTKVSQRARSTSDHTLEMSRVVATRPGPVLVGHSATMILGQLESDDYRELYYEDVWNKYEEEHTVDHDQTRIVDYHGDQREEEMSFVEVEEDDNWFLV